MGMTMAELASIILVGICILKDVILTHYQVKPEKLKYFEKKLVCLTKWLSSNFFLLTILDYVSVDQAIEAQEQSSDDLASFDRR